jgi:hypothetical protein
LFTRGSTAETKSGSTQQPVAVLGEGCGIPHRVLDAEPAKQQIIVDPLDQLPFRADRIQRPQQQRAQPCQQLARSEIGAVFEENSAPLGPVPTLLQGPN